MENNPKNLNVALARAVAGRKVPREVVEQVSNKLAKSKIPIKAIDICTHGICLDYVVNDKNWWETIPKLTEIEGSRIRGIRLFPWGIPVEDIFHIQVDHEIEEFAPFMNR